MNASPSTNTALINNAIDLGLDIVEAPIGAGVLIVRGAASAVAEWINDAAAIMAPAGAGAVTAARVVTG